MLTSEKPLCWKSNGGKCPEWLQHCRRAGFWGQWFTLRDASKLRSLVVLPWGNSFGESICRFYSRFGAFYQENESRMPMGSFSAMGDCATLSLSSTVSQIPKTLEPSQFTQLQSGPMKNHPPLQPFDHHNQKLADHVHPSDWVNPTPSGRYNLVVIGAGTAGLVAAAGAAGLGAKVALIEKHLMGGDCLNTGCVPSKAILAAAKAATTHRDSQSLGVTFKGETHVDFAAVMERMRELRAGISSHDSASRFTGLGVDVFLGAGKFRSPTTAEVAGQTLSFKKAVIATGGRATTFDVPGYDSVEPLTNETLFSLTQLPPRMVVVGGGPIGCEMAQAFAKLGSQVTLVDRNAQILGRQDAEAAEVVRAEMERDGVRFVMDATVERFEKLDDGKMVVCQSGGTTIRLECDQILVGIGRTPNVHGLGLEEAGVEFDSRQGVRVNDRLQTTQKNIFAAGDVASKYKFTHAADFMSRAVIGNALFLGRSKLSRLVIPAATYTFPELAEVGVTAKQAAAEGQAIDTYTQYFSKIDRAILDGDTVGFVRIHTRKDTDKIIGATIVGAHAGDMIGEISLAMTHGIGLKKIASAIHPYPTRAEAIRKIGDQFNKTRLTPLVAKLMKTWLRWTR
jgi:pyruvate/2-oxoglutarate dehydrogenase complex dihydrolipoamide dehydrogenase (E3) component